MGRPMWSPLSTAMYYPILRTYLSCAPTIREARGMRRLTRAYHMAEVANWPAIQRDGLHSASALLDLAGAIGAERARLECCQRLTTAVLPNGTQIRDQRPMPPEALARCLIGMSPRDWYVRINAHVFFWLDLERLNRQCAACNARPQVVLTVD